MMRRRPVVGRRGPGLVGTMARTAVVAGTATAVSGAVAGRQMSKHQEAAQAAAEQQQMAAMQQQMGAMQAQQAAAAMPAQQPVAAASTDPLTERLMQLANLHAQGILTDEEFASAKAKALSAI